MACMERSVGELGRPHSLLARKEHGTKGMRILSHRRGNPDTKVGRSLPVPQRSGRQVGVTARKGEGAPKDYGESDQLMVLRGRESCPHVEGADGHPQPVGCT